MQGKMLLAPLDWDKSNEGLNGAEEDNDRRIGDVMKQILIRLYQTNFTIIWHQW